MNIIGTKNEYKVFWVLFIKYLAQKVRKEVPRGRFSGVMEGARRE
jgi:hypothetical protein